MESDWAILLQAGVAGVIVYATAKVITGTRSLVPLLAMVFVVSNGLGKTEVFKRYVRLAHRYWIRLNHGSSSVHGLRSLSGNEAYKELSEASQSELAIALNSLMNYRSNTKRSNDRRRELFKLMSWRQQNLATKTGYLKRLESLDSLIVANQRFCDSIIDYTLSHYGLDSFAVRKIKPHGGGGGSASNSNYRVVEALSHFLRDWPDTEISPEIEPMVQFVTQQLERICGNKTSSYLDGADLVVPGSGLGRLSYELAKRNPKWQVSSIEYSGLMSICNSYVFNENPNPLTTFYPFIHGNSNIICAKDQARSITFTPRVKPGNLNHFFGDFRFFKLAPNSQSTKPLVIVTCFFIDTAENLIEYIDTLNNLASSSKRTTYWINVGPLKYGSAAQIEPTVEELTELRKLMGWKDITNFSSIDDDANDGSLPKLVSYITDTKSFWQGYYGVHAFACKKT